MSANYGSICDLISTFIKDELHNAKREKVVVGLSGGLDSSVTVCLAARALSNEDILSLILPDFPITPESDVVHATELARNLQINHKIIDVSNIKSEFVDLLPRNQYAEGNLTARIRMSILYYYAYIYDGLVLGTSDRSELLLGYYTKFGDGAADLFPLGGLYKTQVRALARYLKLPLSILEKESSPRLWLDQTAEGELGAKYEEIDDILKYLEYIKNTNNSIRPYKDRISNEKLAKIEQVIKKNAHKTMPLKICDIRSKF